VARGLAAGRAVIRKEDSHGNLLPGAACGCSAVRRIGPVLIKKRKGLDMATDSPTSGGDYEFNPEQNQLIGDLARKMMLVGFVMMLFGALQVAQGIMSLIAARNPARVISAAKEAGVPDERLQQLQTALAAEGWLSPLGVSSLAIALGGVFLLLVGLWTQQAGAGFVGIVRTRGQDISRLMDALRALHKKYTLMYTLLWIAAIISLLSFLLGVYHAWSARG
jgi:hypothetical protein